MGIGSISFHPNGKPRGWLRKILFRRNKDVRPLFRRVVYKKNGEVRPRYRAFLPGLGDAARAESPPVLEDWLRARWIALQAIPAFPQEMANRRITIVTDSTSPSSLFGGVGTALIFGALLAERSGADLRIVTRTEAPNSLALGNVLSANGLRFDGRVEFCFCPQNEVRELAIGPKDLFVSTSWWTTRSLLNTVNPGRIVYLLQEDERMFYPYGDDRLECERTMAARGVSVVINTNLLRESLISGSDAIVELADRAVAFEPAFSRPASRELKNAKAGDSRKRLFFYARPANTRNMFATAVMAIGAAVLRGVIDANDWELHAVGNGCPEITFPCGLNVVYHHTMSWAEYQALVETMDAGFVLMYTPHPSYPPLDLASMGIPVLTNRFGLKRDLKIYSDNLICVDLDEDALVAGFAELMALAADESRRATNLASDRIQRDWSQALSHVMDHLETLHQN